MEKEFEDDKMMSSNLASEFEMTTRYPSGKVNEALEYQIRL